ncbi:N-formylglutamate amidohydrolase [Leisingera sp. M523]|uniref:N-formylglutamate amidohydrolase n=1 Tax=Leisingera sp. M523 TaxID=2867013 RepID=UPI0021A4A247|nr:N-formylglutamate amidohydrolase [Leisingera sp. M523]UWQ29348.1 N-formylglutamate amidohydrolase [Leisingera sp. M523]
MTYTPYFVHGADRPARWLITCDHATNHVPEFAGGGDLGLPRTDMERHIAYDIGAYEVAKLLGGMLDAPVVASNFSRLVIDPNRGEDDPTLLMKLYDGTIIPANRHAGAAELQERLEACYRPYHRALARLAERPGTVVVSVHSFTRQLRGREPRPWEIGILFPEGERFSPFVIEELKAGDGLCVGINEPYTGHLPGDAIETHATHAGRPNTLIELRNDLIAEHDGQCKWAERLAKVLPQALENSGL